MAVEAEGVRTGGADAYANPTNICDLIMKGGITSGVIYPSAVCELAKVYNFKNVGGASAGAIAAATAAAAEYSRLSGKRRARGKSGFQELEDVPDWLARNLGRLFQPDPPTRPIYDVLFAFLKPGKSLSARARSAFQLGVLNFPTGALAGAALSAPLLLVALLTMVYAPRDSGWIKLLGVVGFVYTLLLTMLFAALGVAAKLFGRVLSTLPDNLYGLCSGCDPAAKYDPTPPLHRDETAPLTNWLADELDQIAGMEEGRPLTFGDLWNATGKARAGERDINLEMMTTNLTFGRPYRLPFETRRFYYSPSEFQALFPKRIVEWMVNHPPAPGGEKEEKRQKQVEKWDKIFERQGLRPLPAPEDLPVVVATRMSLSYPVLISAAPLYATDWERANNADARKSGEPPLLERCLFSDGGIGSNFPIHFFDQALPRWPTFGINLVELPDEDAARIRSQSPPTGERGAEEGFVWMAESNSGGITEIWDRFDQSAVSARLPGFLNSIVNTMYNWADNTQMKAPGYRDRIVHVYTTKQEGGLNLNMGEETIRSLGERGKLAGEKLLRRFTGQDDTGLTWDNHRWVRYRSTMSMIEKLLAELADVYQNPLPGDKPYDQLIKRKTGEPPSSYPLKSQRRRAFALRATRELINLSVSWAGSGEKLKGENFIDGAPRPKPEMRIKPRI